MTEEQRKNAMLALGRIVLSIEGLKMDYKQDVQTIIYALQSPPVPSDLDDNITITMDSKGRMIMKLK